MNERRLKRLVLLLLLTTTVTLLVQSSNGQGCKLRVCYFNDAAQHRPTPGRFLPEDIDPTLCSHIIYNSVRVNGTHVVPWEYQASSALDLYERAFTWVSISYSERVLKLKERKPHLKVLLTLRGYYYFVYSFIQIGKNESLRSAFVSNIIKYLRIHKFDGLTLYSGFTGNITIDPAFKQAQSELIAGLMQGFNKEATGSTRLLLTISVYGERIIDDSIYDIPRISQNVDWILLLAYDLHGPQYGTTGHPSPLFEDLSKVIEGQRLSVGRAVTHWMNQGTPTQKIVVALPSFGTAYNLTGEQTGEGAPATTGAAGPFMGINGRLAYYEICSLIQANGTALRLLTAQRVPYLVSGNQWVGYDDVPSVIAKIAYIKKQGLGGFALSYLDLDDFKGAFCGQGNYPLLRVANNKCDE